MKKIVRYISPSKLVLLEYLFSCGGTPDFITARAYTNAPIILHLSKTEKIPCTSMARCFIDGDFFHDLGQLEITGKALEKSHTDVYRLVDELFPELINKGLKSEGYVKFSVSEIEESEIKW